MDVFDFAMAALFVYSISQTLYAVTMAALAHAFGIGVDEVSIGFGPTLWKRHGSQWTWKIGLIPLGSYVQFWGSLDDDDPDRDNNFPQRPGIRYLEASPASRLLIMVSGPATNIALGVALLAVPIVMEAPALLVTSPEQSLIHPCGVGGLNLADIPTTWRSQAQLFRESAVEFCIRLVMFRSLDGWGGIAAATLTVGKIGVFSVPAWFSSVGTVILASGLFNLLPVPVLNGFHILTTTIEAVSGRALPSSIRTPATYLGLAFIAIITVRMFWIDARWLWSALWG